MRDEGPVKIAVDAMGGDRAPEIIVQGAVQAALEQGVSLVMVGDEAAISRELKAAGYSGTLIEIQHCTEVVDMDESPSEAVRRKKDSSIRVAFELVKSGRAQAVVSAGNSGATLAVGTVVLGRLEGVDRPAIAAVFPTVKKGRTVVIDVGANVDCKPHFLFQFGVMAQAYARVALQINNPSIGLLSIGEEDTKGNDLVRQARQLFKDSNLNFIGNIEGRDVFSGAADVVVCDGFVGNVVLKLSEGIIEAVGVMIKEELMAGLVSRLGVVLTHGAFRRFKKKMDYAEFGGAPLLGINGVGLISHGRSSPQAIKNAIRSAAELVQGDVIGRLRVCLLDYEGLTALGRRQAKTGPPEINKTALDQP